MKKIITLLLIVISLVGYSQTHKGPTPKKSERVIEVSSDSYKIDKGGYVYNEKGENKFIIYDNQIQIYPNGRLIPKSLPLKNLTYNIGEKCRDGQYLIYFATIDTKPNKPQRYIMLYYSKPDECYKLEIEYSKHSEIYTLN